MTAKEILRKNTYNRLVTTLCYNPDSLDPETKAKVEMVQEIFLNHGDIYFRSNALKVLKLYLVDGLTIQAIADQLFICERHVKRLKADAVCFIEKLAEHSPPL